MEIDLSLFYQVGTTESPGCFLDGSQTFLTDSASKASDRCRKGWHVRIGKVSEVLKAFEDVEVSVLDFDHPSPFQVGYNPFLDRQGFPRDESLTSKTRPIYSTHQSHYSRPEPTYYPPSSTSFNQISSSTSVATHSCSLSSELHCTANTSTNPIQAH